MDTIISQMFHAISAIMFCVAITILFTAVDISSDILTTATQLNQKEGVEQYVPSAGDVSLNSFAELIMSLDGELEYDVEIDGSYVSKDGYYGLESLLVMPIPGGYQKSYVYDDNGRILYIRYHKEE